MLNQRIHYHKHYAWPKKLKPNQLIANQGQSLLEVVIALAIFALLAASLVTLSVGGTAGLERGGEQTEAAALADEAIEAVRAVRERAWNEIIVSPAKVSIDGTNKWILEPAISELIDSKYTRVINFSDVCRNADNDIADCPSLFSDVHSKKVRVEISWTAGVQVNKVERVAYLTNWDSREWTQTDWSGGAGQPTWLNPSRYFSDDGNIDAGAVGTLRLRQQLGSWSPYGGNSFTDTTDDNFNAGSYQGTAISGFDELASVILGQSAAWSEHPDSAIVTSNDIRAISAVSDTDVWAVGNRGTILHYYNGTSGLRWYNYTPSPTTEHLYGIHMLSSSVGWAVGNRGTIIRYSGGVWSAVSSPVTRDLNSVFFLNASTGWAVGARGTVVRYNSLTGTWVNSSLAVTNNLYGVHMTSTAAGGGWIVGANGFVRRWNGSKWAEYSQSVTTRDLKAVYMLGVNDVWAVGNQGTILRFTGSWAPVSVSPPVGNNLFGIDMLSSASGWAVGASATVLNYSGGSWTSADLGAPALFGVEFPIATHGFAVGASGRIYEYSANAYNNSGTFLSGVFDGATVTTWNSLFWSETLPAGSSITIATRSGNTLVPGGGWSSFSTELVNSGGSTIMSPPNRYFQYRATLNRGISSAATPALADLTILYNSPTTANLNDLSIVPGSGGNNIWAVGSGGVILNYNGALWSVASSPVTDNLYGVFMLSASNGWAVGDSGKILKYNGIAWTENGDTGAESWRSVAFISANDGWVVGASGRIARYNGTWDENISSPVGGMLNRVVVLSVNDVWAVGNTNNAEIIHYNGTVWSTYNLLGAQNANGIFMISPTLGWVGGDSGEISRYNGTGWIMDKDTGAETWNSIGFTSVSSGWAVGNGGAIAYWNGSVWDDTILSPTANNLNRVAMASASNGWAVGNNGTIIHLDQGSTYALLASLVSSAYSLADISPVQIIDWDGDLSCAPNCEIKFQVSTAPDNGSGQPGAWTEWYGAGGVGTYFTAARGSLIPLFLNNNFWVRYRVELIGDGTATPILDEVRINYK